MDLAENLLGIESFFIGGDRPCTPRDQLQKFCLQMGASVTAFTERRRRNINVVSKSGTRKLKPPAPLQSMFHKRYMKSGRRLTTDMLGLIIELSMYEQTDDPDGSGDIILFKMLDATGTKKRNKLRELARSATEATQRIRSKSAKVTESFTPDELIEHLAFAVRLEAYEAAFPYLSFHRVCLLLLQSVQDACDSTLRRVFGPMYITQRRECTCIVGFTLMMACGWERGVADVTTLEQATAVISKFAATGASKILKEKVLGEVMGLPVKFVTEEEHVLARANVAYMHIV